MMVKDLRGIVDTFRKLMSETADSNYGHRFSVKEIETKFEAMKVLDFHPKY